MPPQPLWPSGIIDYSRRRLDWRLLGPAVVLVPIMYSLPLLLGQAPFVTDVVRVVLYGVPVLTSLFLCVLFDWLGYVIATGASLVALVLILLMTSDQQVLAVVAVVMVLTVQLVITIITFLVANLRSRVDELRRANRRLSEIALSDEMTGLYNYRYFMIRLAEELDAASRYARPCALLVLDIDNFKHFNDVHGHQLGDDALRQFASIMQANCRTSDIVARYGGDEFVVIAPRADPVTTRILAERLLTAAVHETVGQIGVDRLTVSIGVSVFPLWASTREQLINQADTALYHAKLQGGNCVSLHGEMAGDGVAGDREDTAVLAAVRTLLGIISARDGYTYGHSQRVMRDALEIGRRMGLDAADLRTLQWAALVHDLGKLELSKRVLLKPDQLAPEEWEAIRRHPEASARLIEPVIERMGSIAETVRSHHESYDGSGYPHGLKGNQIPLSARILTVADAIDAMRSERPYREGLTVAEIVTELEKCKGWQFDPQVVDTAVKTLEENWIKA